MQKKTTYSEKLKDPRWQKIRLKILERDNWKCQDCGNSKNMLVVHHRYYIKGKEPWDYPNNILVTLCKDCHQLEHYHDPFYLIEVLKNKGFSNQKITILGDFINRCKSSDKIHSWFKFLISDTEKIK